MKKVILTIFIIIATVFSFAYIAKESKPNDSLYKIKRLQERLTIMIKTSPKAKAEYYLYLLDQRLEDMHYIYDVKLDDLAISTSLRYAATAGELTNILKNNNLTEIKPQVKEKFENHRAVIKGILDSYPYQDEKWKFYQDAINYLDLYLNELK